MDCPVCKDKQLVMSERQGIEIDYCPSCRGVWLDRGELDKLIEKSSAMNVQAAAPQTQPQSQSMHQPPPQQAYHQPYPQRHDSKHYYQKKPKNWLSEFFD